MKMTLRIPTRHQYAYIEVEHDSDGILTEEGLKTTKETYEKLTEIFAGENKYSETTFNEMISKIMDSDITEWQIGVDDYQHLTESQQKVFQSIKRFLKRLPEVE